MDRIAQIKADMKLWREGLAPLPLDYIALHEVHARADLKRFVREQGVLPLDVRMVSDGWGDGMKVLEVICIPSNPRQRGTVSYRWSDANGGSWFLVGAGQSLVEVAPNGPGRL